MANTFEKKGIVKEPVGPIDTGTKVEKEKITIAMIKEKLSQVFKKGEEPIPVPTDPTIKEK